MPSAGLRRRRTVAPDSAPSRSARRGRNPSSNSGGGQRPSTRPGPCGEPAADVGDQRRHRGRRRRRRPIVIRPDRGGRWRASNVSPVQVSSGPAGARADNFGQQLVSENDRPGATPIRASVSREGCWRGPATAIYRRRRPGPHARRPRTWPSTATITGRGDSTDSAAQAGAAISRDRSGGPPSGGDRCSPSPHLWGKVGAPPQKVGSRCGRGHDDPHRGGSSAASRRPLMQAGPTSVGRTARFRLLRRISASSRAPPARRRRTRPRVSISTTGGRARAGCLCDRSLSTISAADRCDAGRAGPEAQAWRRRPGTPWFNPLPPSDCTAWSTERVAAFGPQRISPCWRALSRPPPSSPLS